MLINTPAIAVAFGDQKRASGAIQLSPIGDRNERFSIETSNIKHLIRLFLATQAWIETQLFVAKGPTTAIRHPALGQRLSEDLRFTGVVVGVALQGRQILHAGQAEAAL